MEDGRDSEKPEGIERRGATRISRETHPEVPGQVNFRLDEVRGSGVLHDVSVTGALVAEVTFQLEVGSQVDLYFVDEYSQRRIRAHGEIVRRTRSGFAVRFLRVERQLKQLVMAAVSKKHKPKP